MLIEEEIKKILRPCRDIRHPCPTPVNCEDCRVKDIIGIFDNMVELDIDQEPPDRIENIDDWNAEDAEHERYKRMITPHDNGDDTISVWRKVRIKKEDKGQVLTKMRKSRTTRKPPSLPQHRH